MATEEEPTPELVSGGFFERRAGLLRGPMPHGPARGILGVSCDDLGRQYACVVDPGLRLGV